MGTVKKKPIVCAPQHDVTHYFFKLIRSLEPKMQLWWLKQIFKTISRCMFYEIDFMQRVPGLNALRCNSPLRP